MSPKVMPGREAQKEETISNKEFVSFIDFPHYFPVLKTIITIELKCLPGQFQISYMTL